MALVLRELAGADPMDPTLMACQALRYRVYHHDLGLDTDDMDHARGLDLETNDAVSDLLAVTDDKTGEVVGTLRLQQSGGARPLLVEREFELVDPWFRERPLVEGARFAVAAAYRNGPVPLMLFDGMRRWSRRNGILDLIGIAILPDPAMDVGVARPVFDWIAHRTTIALARARPAPGYAVDAWDASVSDDVVVDPAVESVVDVSALPPMVKMLSNRRATLCSVPGYCRSFRAWSFLLTTRLVATEAQFPPGPRARQPGGAPKARGAQ